ncbi:LuxR family transcriptional regulator [Sphaerisporangium krabiense]|uniref:DNA-binding CsgD family transcriptional regulator/tetratricopeptide (TPR) repeat protein n=1 Tax=Sphaerisporangium krabiense TaxID=763782 RepID=A0A7W8Z3J2_9ACTN|nr:LuxR family transcriptional regulator [Sphaerisporangium krabiense]MBB5626808.1 DNA-binding CsgD family transcriptional regulator/tetratricopeptide (TPR) repeat protein [Sphaerisporangium krabiense]GII67394.1 LuxR family transcriptional regulator [Sphaerisporangium krabiense]
MAAAPRQRTPGRSQTASPILIGRRSELEELTAALVSPPAVAMIEGEAGVGKSRLVRELIAQPALRRLRILPGYCQPLREPFRYGPILEALGTLRGHPPPFDRDRLSPVTGMLHALLPELSEFLPDPPEPTGDPRSERHRVYRAVRELLSAVGPAMLLVEDLHWTDDGSRSLLSFLMADLPQNLAIVVTYRREEAPGGVPLGSAYRPPPGATSVLVSLKPLDLAEVRALASSMHGGRSITLDFATKLYERTAGLPFVVEETMRALGDPAGTSRLEGPAARQLLENVEVPVLLREAMAERLAGLPIAAVRLAEAAAVLGVPATVELLQEVAGLTGQRSRAALAAALSSGVLHEADDCLYGYRHTLAQQAVYDTMAGFERRRLHARAIEALRRREPRPLVRLADHSHRAGRAGDALRYGEEAADRAIREGDASTATQQLQRLLLMPELTAADVDRLAVKLGEIAHTGLDQHDPAATLERVLGDPRLSTAARGEVRLFLGLLLIRQAGGLQAGLDAIETAIGELDERPDLLGRGVAVLALPYFGTTPLPRIRPWTERLGAMIDEATGEELRLTMLANYAPALVQVGEPGALRAFAPPARDAAMTPAEQRNLSRLHCNLADACACTGHHREAGPLLREGLRMAVEVGAPFVVSTGRATTARLDWLLGEWDGLEERALGMLDEYHDLLPNASELSLVLGWLAGARGDWDEAEGWLNATGVAAPHDSITPVVVSGFAALAKVRLARGETDAALADARRGLEIVRRKEVWAWAGELVPVAVSVLLECGRFGEAQTLAGDLARGVADRDAPMAKAALEMASALLAEAKGEVGLALRHYERARRAYGELPAPYYAALAAERLWVCRLENGSPGAAEELAALADAFAAMGATWDADRCGHHLRVHGVTRSSRRGRRGYGDTLSPREQDVARLLARGRTNREIAEVLFLSPRTVEQHVARTLRKLGKRSRNDLLDG